ncbi:MAG: hypothetical protein F6J95_029145 [Leptolyngbya sp. SIO1E4]|nr:hypothetical protein [Leptolyngbya sp. SIO1E4]
MPGPSWFVRQGAKELLKSIGADPGTATVGGYVASTVSSLVFHDHHTHFVPDADQVADVADSLSDSTDAIDQVADIADSPSDSTDAIDHTQNPHGYASTPRPHFGSYDSSPDAGSDTPDGSYLTSSSTIEPNEKYELPDGQVVYGSEIREGSGGNVYSGSSSNYGQSSTSDGVSKTNIKKAS